MKTMMCLFLLFFPLSGAFSQDWSSAYSGYKDAEAAFDTGDFETAHNLYTTGWEKADFVKSREGGHPLVFENKTFISGFYKDYQEQRAEFEYKTLYILVSDADLERLNHKKMENPIKNTMSLEDIERIKRQARLFDMLLTALTDGRVAFSHEIKIAKTTQKDLFLVSEVPWWDRVVNVYDTHLDTFDPPLSDLFREKTADFDSFSIVLPDTLPENTPSLHHLVEGGINPQGMPFIPYTYYGPRRALFVNNLRSFSFYQLMHEFFHMIERLTPLPYEKHCWVDAATSPPGVESELDYYKYSFEKILNENYDIFSFRLKDRKRSENIPINIEEKRYKKALEYYRAHEEDELLQAFLNYKQGVLRSYDGDATGARRYYEESLAVVKDYPFPNVKLARYLINDGKYFEAYRHLLEGFEIDSTNPERIQYLAWCFDYHFDRKDLVLPFALFALELKEWHPDSAGHLHKSVIRGYIYARGIPEALEYIKKYGTDDPIYDYLRGECYFYLGKYQTSLEYFSKYPETASYGELASRYKECLIHYYLDKEITVEADSAGMADTGGDWYSLYQEARGETDTAKALELYLRALKKNRNHWLVWWGLASTYQKRDKIANAIYSWNRILDLNNPEDSQLEYVYKNTSTLYFKIKDWEKAADTTVKAIDVIKKLGKTPHLVYYYNLIKSYEHLGMPGKGIEVLRELENRVKESDGFYYTWVPKRLKELQIAAPDLF